MVPEGNHLYLVHIVQMFNRTSDSDVRINTCFECNFWLNRDERYRGIMKKALLLFGMVLMSSASVARADIYHKMTTSAALQVDAASTSVSRVGTTYSTSGNNVTTTVTPSGGSAGASLGGLVAPTSATAAATVVIPDATQTVAGNAFSYTSSFTAGDAIVTTAPTTGTTTAGYSNQYATAAGTGGSGQAQVTSAHNFAVDSNGATITAIGGAGSTVTTQFVSELTVR